MRKSWLMCVLLGTLAWGQAAPSAASPQPAQTPAANGPKAESAPDTSASVPGNAAVITIDGVCTPQPKSSTAKGTAAKPATKAESEKTPADCKTVITKAEFEKLVSAVAPNPTPQQKKQLASVLPRFIAMSNEARKQGMDKTEQYKEMLKFVQMQVLTTQLQRKLQDQAANISDADIEKYYKENPQAYEQYNIDRIFVPRSKQVEAEAKEDEDDKLTDEQKKAKEEAEKAKADANEQAMTKLATDLRARAAAGEDITKLQKEAFDAAGMKIESPTVNLPSVRRTGLPQAHVAVFDLKPGEVSQVISDTGGHYIYRMNSKTALPLDQAKNEIHGKLQNDRMRERMEKLNNSFHSTTNEADFGPGGAGPMPPPRMPRPRPGVPPATPSAQPQPPAAGQPPAAQPAPQKD